MLCTLFRFLLGSLVCGMLFFLLLHSLLIFCRLLNETQPRFDNFFYIFFSLSVDIQKMSLFLCFIGTGISKWNTNGKIYCGTIYDEWQQCHIIASGFRKPSYFNHQVFILFSFSFYAWKLREERRLTTKERKNKNLWQKSNNIRVRQQILQNANHFNNHDLFANNKKKFMNILRFLIVQLYK